MIKCRSIPIKDVRKMLKLIDLHIDTGKEHGMILCKNSDKIVTSDSCKGSKCAISLKKWEKLSCPKGMKEIGEYHTHPMNIFSSFPSGDDIKVSAIKNHKLLCIGTGEKNTEYKRNIHCYNIKNRELKRLGKEYSRTDDEKRKEEIGKSINTVMTGKKIVGDLLNAKCTFEDVQNSDTYTILEEDDITIEYENDKAYKIDLIKLEKIPVDIEIST